ncbi:hypothetical protein MASR2M78_23750 [Treponema sp.]
MNVASSHPQYITDENGHKTAIILKLDEYSELLEDLSDLAAVAERRNEETISHTDLLAQLKAEGLL